MPTELKKFRERYGGEKYNKRAINKHSIRVYEVKGLFFKLDRTLDGWPPFFNLEYLSFDPSKERGMGRTVQIEGKDYWGSGYTWGKAQKAAFAAMEKFCEEQFG